ncbi:MAG: hypothetical protein R3E08_01250 [Thiotrichaceae bacterium]
MCSRVIEDLQQLYAVRAENSHGCSSPVCKHALGKTDTTADLPILHQLCTRLRSLANFQI